MPDHPTIDTAAPPLTVVVSRGQSRHPEKRGLENAVVQLCEAIPGASVLSVPHLYDVPHRGDVARRLSAIDGPIVVVSWIFERAARWVLARHGVATERQLRCIDLKDQPDPNRVADRVREQIREQICEQGPGDPAAGLSVERLEESTKRRWYPVIDFDRCTNCMECVDFCLFGVYGIDQRESILVEQPDNCRKGCPACSRVCPENAIMFPQHKAPAIAGAAVEDDAGFKIDLSQLFGAPATSDNDRLSTAARERDEQLLLTGREAKGFDEQLAALQRQAGPKDRWDDLIESLEAETL